MRLLLDSHAFVWWAEANRALSAAARMVIADPANEVLVSVAGVWELVIKAQLGKLPPLPDDVETMIATQGFSLLPINFVHLRRYAPLQQHHNDPFDRMMIAQALAENMPIVTRDRVFAAYGVQIIR